MTLTLDAPIAMKEYFAQCDVKENVVGRKTAIVSIPIQKLFADAGRVIFDYQCQAYYGEHSVPTDIKPNADHFSLILHLPFPLIGDCDVVVIGHFLIPPDSHIKKQFTLNISSTDNNTPYAHLMEVKRDG